MTIGITGATGQLGRLIIANLVRRVPPADLVGLVRSPGKAANLGIPVRLADYTNSETLRLALSGVDTLLFVSASELGQRPTRR